MLNKKIIFFYLIYLIYNITIREIIFLFPEISLLIGIIIIFFYGLFSKKNQLILNFNLIILSIWILVIVIYELINMPVEFTIYFLNLNFVISPIIQYIKIIILIMGIIIIYFSKTALDFKQKNLFEIIILILFLILNFLFLISINDLILLIFFIELHSIIAFTLTGLYSNSNLSKEGMIKFFILGAIASAFLGFGVSILYIMFGTTNINELKFLLIDLFISDMPFYLLFILGVIFFWIGFLFKLAVVPFHFWIADVYQSAPNIVVLFFATIPQLAYVFIFSNLIFLLNVNLILFLLVLSILYGTIMSIYQVKIMRLLGYSAIVHISFVLIAIMQCNILGLISGLIYIIVYSFLNITLFLIIFSFKNIKNINQIYLIEIVDFSKIIKYNPILTFILIMTFFSIGGIPPLGGFFIKWYIFNTLIASNNFFLTFFLLIISIINAVFYIRCVRLIFFNNDKILYIDNLRLLDFFILLIIIFLFLLNIFFVFFHIYFFINLFSLII